MTATHKQTQTTPQAADVIKCGLINYFNHMSKTILVIDSLHDISPQ